MYFNFILKSCYIGTNSRNCIGTFQFCGLHYLYNNVVCYLLS